MIINFLKFGIITLLSSSCQKIDIKNLDIHIKSKKFTGKIDKLVLKAENIIFNYLFIYKLKLKISNLLIKISFKKKFLNLNNFFAEILIQLNNDNIKNIVLNDRNIELRRKIEEFATNNKPIEDIFIKDKSINFLSDKIYISNFSLNVENNIIILKDNYLKKEIRIPIDPNIEFHRLLIIGKYIFIKLSSKVSLNNL